MGSEDEQVIIDQGLSLFNVLCSVVRFMTGRTPNSDPFYK